MNETVEDFKFGVEHFFDIERLAIFCKPFTKAVVRYFEQDNAAAVQK